MASQEDLTGSSGNAYFVGVENSGTNSRAIGVWKITGGMVGSPPNSAAMAKVNTAWAVGDRFSLEVEFRYSLEVYEGFRIIIRKGDLNFDGMVTQLDTTAYTAILTTTVGAGFYIEDNSVGSLSTKLDRFQTYTGTLLEV